MDPTLIDEKSKNEKSDVRYVCIFIGIDFIGDDYGATMFTTHPYIFMRKT